MRPGSTASTEDGSSAEDGETDPALRRLGGGGGRGVAGAFLQHQRTDVGVLAAVLGHLAFRQRTAEALHHLTVPDLLHGLLVGAGHPLLDVDAGRVVAVDGPDAEELPGEEAG